jgi:hypothetical protein
MIVMGKKMDFILKAGIFTYSAINSSNLLTLKIASRGKINIPVNVF